MAAAYRGDAEREPVMIEHTEAPVSGGGMPRQRRPDPAGPLPEIGTFAQRIGGREFDGEQAQRAGALEQFGSADQSLQAKLPADGGRDDDG